MYIWRLIQVIMNPLNWRTKDLPGGMSLDRIELSGRQTYYDLGNNLENSYRNNTDNHTFFHRVD